jgi:hypothetical protein
LGIVVDDTVAELTGEWARSTAVAGYVGRHYLHDSNADKGKCLARFVASITTAGQYEVRLSYTPHANRASNVSIVVKHAEGERKSLIDQRKPPTIDRRFVSLGKFRFEAGRPATVTISTAESNGHVVVDAVQLLQMPAK